MQSTEEWTLEEVAYSADATTFLRALARIVARLFGAAESSKDNDLHDEADETGLLDEGSEDQCE